MKRKPKVLVVIPAKDEEPSIEGVLHRIKAKHPSFDILVIDDGSTDRTVKIARERGALAISHGRNLGIAAAIQTGRIHALEHDHDFVIFCDADGQHNPLDIGKIASPLLNKKADFVIGSRELGSYVGHESLPLKLSRSFCSLVISTFCRQHITDPTSGFKGWNRRLIEHLKTTYETSNKLHLSTTNDMEEILIAHKKGGRIIEVPVKMFCREGESTIYTTHNPFYFLTVFPWHLIRTLVRNL